METVAAIGAIAVVFGVGFFLFCAGLVFWYLLKQAPQIAAANAPEPAIQASIEHPTAASSAPADAPGADG
jgi:hypothetical protein